jgi:hypothetical protein
MWQNALIVVIANILNGENKYGHPTGLLPFFQQ